MDSTIPLIAVMFSLTNQGCHREYWTYQSLQTHLTAALRTRSDHKISNFDNESANLDWLHMIVTKETAKTQTFNFVDDITIISNQDTG